MRKCWVLVCGIAGVCLFLVSCTANKGFVAAVDAEVAANARNHGIPAQSVLVTHNGELIYQRHMGTLLDGGGAPVDGDTVFPVFSVSKLFATVLLFEEVEAGRIDLDAPAIRYLPTMPKAWEEITVRQFLDHVSGVGEYFDESNLAGPFPPTLADALSLAAARPMADRPDTRSRYTQTNFLVIGAILEAVTGKSYRELVQTRILSPLGRNDVWLGASGIANDRLVRDYHGEAGKIVADTPIAWPDYASPHTGIHATAEGLAAVLDAIAAGRFVSQKALTQLWQPHAFANGDRGWFASGWDYGESGEWREVGHDGSAKLRVRILFRGDLPSERYVIVYLTNGSADNVWSRTLVESVQRHLEF